MNRDFKSNHKKAVYQLGGTGARLYFLLMY